MPALLVRMPPVFSKKKAEAHADFYPSLEGLPRPLLRAGETAFRTSPPFSPKKRGGVRSGLLLEKGSRKGYNFTAFVQPTQCGLGYGVTQSVECHGELFSTEYFVLEGMEKTYTAEKMRFPALQVIRVYWKESKKYKPLIFCVLFSVFLSSGANLMIPLVYKRFFDALALLVPSLESSRQILPVLFWILGFNGLVWVGYRLGGWATALFQARVMTDLRQRAFDYLLLHSHGFFADNFSGSLVQKVGRLPRSFAQFTDRLFWDLLPLAFRIAGVSVILWAFNKTIALVVMVWVALFIAVNFALSFWKMKYNIKKAQEDSRTTAALADAVTNQSAIQLFGGFSYESGRFGRVVRDLQNIALFTWNLEVLIEAVQGFFVLAAEFLLFFFALKYWSIGLATIGMFVMIQAYLLQLMSRLWDFGRIVRGIYESFADAAEMVEIFETPHEIQNSSAAKILRVSKGEIEFRDVQFFFKQTRAVLKNLNICIRPGEKVALVGPSGAGKSTIVKLLFRLYDVDAGAILIDGQDIRRVTQESLRSCIGLVPQDTVLFHRTLMENIRYGKRDATDAQVLRASKLAHCHDFIKNLSYGYDTLVGERGVKLSGGERQRVAIARAILKNAPILVLDEATSSLDSESEMLIQNALETLMKNRTTIVIAHRLSTIRKMDRVIVIDNGVVAEQGAHEELLKSPDSMYAKLWNLQAGGFLIQR